ncbi:F-box/WD repeat-containing protein 7-like [Littorina saxatilis]|uniref:F-box/WD repeat-containing protein 7-like n=1 Tax=Littorina saxatilis TaxID=31220 RepID=UPI0038B450BC
MGNSHTAEPHHAEKQNAKHKEKGSGEPVNSLKTVTAEEFTLVLPPELSEKILQYLSPWDLCQFQQVCMQYREVGNTDKLWLHYCLVRGWLRFGVSNSILHEAPLYTKLTNVSGTSPVFELCVPEETRLSPLCRWKNVYIRMRHLSNNWALGRYTVSPMLRGHTDKVTAMDCEGYTLVSGSNDKQLKVWDIRSCECMRTMRGHTDTVSAVKLKGQYVITGCGDSGVRVFDLKTGKVCFSFQGHGGSVDHIQIIGNLVISGGTDRTLRVWDLTNKCLLHTLRGHDDDIECVTAHKGMVLSGSWDRTLILWKIDSGKMIHHYQAHSEAITAAQFDEVKVVSGSADGDVRIWSVNTGQCTMELSGHPDNEVYCVVYNAEVIAAGYSDSIVRIWGHDGSLIHCLKEHLGVVRCLHINNERLVSGGDQKKIVIWDYREGKKLNVAHRNPTRLQQMLVTDTRIITASPETPGTLSILSYW